MCVGVGIGVSSLQMVLSMLNVIVLCYVVLFCFVFCLLFMRRSRVGDRGPDLSLKNHKNIRFLSNTGPDPLKNHKATKPVFNVGPSSASQGKAIQMTVRWRADDGLLLVLFLILFPLKLDSASDKTFWIPT